jgi:hypothetical protein
MANWPRSLITAEKELTTFRTSLSQVFHSRRRPGLLDRVAIAFRLAGIGLGTEICLPDAFKPFRHTLGWGISFGCFKARMSALFGKLTKRTPASLSRVPAGEGRSPAMADQRVFPALEVYLCSGLNDAGPPSLNKTFALRAFPCVLGRHPACDHRLGSAHISRLHCAFSVRGGQVWVEDLGSRNGTRLNGRLVEGLQPLHDGDWLELGNLPFKVRLAGLPVEWGGCAERAWAR